MKRFVLSLIVLGALLAFTEEAWARRAKVVIVQKSAPKTIIKVKTH